MPQKAKYTKQFPFASLSQTKHYIFTTNKRTKKKKNNRNFKKLKYKDNFNFFFRHKDFAVCIYAAKRLIALPSFTCKLKG